MIKKIRKIPSLKESLKKIQKEALLRIKGMVSRYLKGLNTKSWKVKKNRDTYYKVIKGFGTMFRQRAISRKEYDMFIGMMDKKREKITVNTKK